MKFKEAPIGAVFDVRNGATPASENPAFWDGDISWVGPVDLGQLTVRHIEHGKRSITHAGYTSCGTQLVPPGTILLSTRAPIGHVAIASREICFNQGCRGLVPRNAICSDFAYWALLARIPQLEAAGQGTTFLELSRDKLKAARIPLPDLPTQKAIADFLDRETARIDQLIEKKQRMVEVLGERLCAEREASVWVHSKFAKLGHHVSILSGYAFPSDGFSDDPLDDRLLRGANVGVDTLRWDDVVYWPADDCERLKRFRLEIGDLVMGMDRPWISGGMRVATVGPDDVPSFLLQRVCKIKPRATMNGMFLKELLHSRHFLAHFEPILTGVSVPHISPDQIVGFRFPYIDPDVQASQMEHFAKLVRWVRRAIYTTKTSIYRLREFRSALITAAVTGQIDVSTWSKQGMTERRFDQIEEATSA